MIAAAVLVLGCQLDDLSSKDRCAKDDDCNASRICVSGVCDDRGLVVAEYGNRDFNHDGHNDVLWHDDTTGATQVWYMDGSTLIGTADFDQALDVDEAAGWRLAGVGDFNQDGQPDIVARNGITGVTEVWYMAGVMRIGRDQLDPSLDITDDSGWSLGGVCDFDRDGQPDLLWYQANTDAIQVWYMQGAVRGGYANLAGPADPSLSVVAGSKVVGTGDFNRDGKPDVLWYNAATANATVWLMDGISFASATSLVSAPDASMPVDETLLEAEDFNLDGWPDLVWKSGVTDAVEIWLMTSFSRSDQIDVAVAPDGANWTIVPH